MSSHRIQKIKSFSSSAQVSDLTEEVLFEWNSQISRSPVEEHATTDSMGFRGAPRVGFPLALMLG